MCEFGDRLGGIAMTYQRIKCLSCRRGRQFWKTENLNERRRKIVEKGIRKLNLKTKRGCTRILAIFIALIIVSSFFACLIQADFGTVKVEHITIDARGAELTAELYYPAGTTGHDSMPAVIVNHGGGCIYGAIKIWLKNLHAVDSLL